MQKFKPAGLVFGSALLIVPAFALYHHTGLSQQTYMENNLESSHLSWALAQTAPVESDEALSRANTCLLAHNTFDESISHTVFNRNFEFDSPEDARAMEGRFFCALDGSTVQIIGGKAANPVLVDPSELDNYHQMLVEIHHVNVAEILKFKEQNSDKSN